MAIKKSETKKTEEKKTVPAAEIKVDRAKEFEKSISFDMTLYDTVKIYGCTYRTYKDKKTGEEKGIISFPAKQGKDEKWYDHAHFFVTDEALEAIEKQIEALI